MGPRTPGEGPHATRGRAGAATTCYATHRARRRRPTDTYEIFVGGFHARERLPYGVVSWLVSVGSAGLTGPRTPGEGPHATRGRAGAATTCYATHRARRRRPTNTYEILVGGFHARERLPYGAPRDAWTGGSRNNLLRHP